MFSFFFLCCPISVKKKKEKLTLYIKYENKIMKWKIIRFIIRKYEEMLVSGKDEMLIFFQVALKHKFL